MSAILWGFSLRRIRKSGRFELFYYTHFAYIAWFVLALSHGPRFYKFALLPLIAFGFEWLLRRRRRVHVSRMLALSGLSSGVTRLELECPPGLQAAPGRLRFLEDPAPGSLRVASVHDQQRTGRRAVVLSHPLRG